MAKSWRLPKYALHRPSGQARVRIDGKEVYLGPFDSPESRRRYKELTDSWLEEKRAGRPKEMTVAQLAILYTEHADGYYVKDGRPTSQIHRVRVALRPLVKLYRNLSVGDFGPVKLERVRKAIVESGVSRGTANAYVSVIIRAFRWGVSKELVAASVLTALEAVDGLRAGRCAAPETEPVQPVPVAIVEATLPHLPTVLQEAVRLQLATGMRPAEVLRMRGCDLNTSGEIWEYRPRGHKMIHHGRSRVVCIGPRGQEIIRRRLTTDLAAFLFSPNGDGAKPYTPAAYRRAITRAGEIAFGMPDRIRKIATTIRRLKDPADPRKPASDELKAMTREQLRAEAAEWRKANCWAPNRTRHTFGTQARRLAGIEAARVTLGHSSAVTSEIYAERDLEQARAIVAKLG